MGKIIKYRNLSLEVKQVKRQSKKIVLVGGCFDLLHTGHIEFLNKAKKLGDSLIVLLESDATVKRLKGVGRPINKQKDRAIVLSHIVSIDYIIMLPPLRADKAYVELVKSIEPAIIAVTAHDPIINLKKRQAKLVNAKVIEVMKRKKGYSTQDLIRKVNTEVI